MLLINEWKDERDTLQRLSQILGKHKLASSFKEPQWAHVILNVTTTGFTTGLLYYEDKTYELAVNLRDHIIEIITDTETVTIPLEDGKTVKYYDAEIEKVLEEHGIFVKIYKKPQEVEETTPFDEDEIHHHYNEEIAHKALELMKFSVKVLEKFMSPYRMRKINPGLFWGTFDIACLVIYNKIHRSFDDSTIIESNAFDEHFIEFGFWFGDDNFKGPTFFILPHPFVDKDFKADANMPEEVYFDSGLTEYIFEIEDMSDETARKLVEFMEEGYRVFRNHLGWENIEFSFIPLRIKDNQLEENWEI